MNIKDFILTEEIEEKKKTTTASTPAEYTFSLEYENDYDFILKRTTQKTEKMLVCIVSQGQVYFKDVKQNKAEKITDVSQIRTFIRGMSDVPNFERLQWKPFGRDYRWRNCERHYYTYVDDSFDRFLDHVQTYKILSNKKINPFKNSGIVYEYEQNPDAFTKTNEVLKIMKLIDPSFTTNTYGYSNISHNLIEGNLTYNTIKANLDIINELTSDDFKELLRNTQFYSIIKDYLCDFRTLLKYILYTIKYRNGLEIGSYFNVSQYIDYLRMQQEMYGKVKEKYPLYWLSEKQMMINKYNKWKEMRRIEGFDLGQESLKTLEFEDDVYRVIIPLKSTDILDEAQQQQHCVASYVNRIARGDTHIVFIRQKLNEEESCLTVEVTPDNEIVQVRGFQNRLYNALEYSFMEKWAKEKNLKLEVAKIV